MKLLVISLAGIGDTLFATPLIHELRLNFPHAIIEALVMWPGSADVLRDNPHLNTVHQRNLLDGTKTEAIAFLRQIGRRGYDVSINTIPQSKVDYRIVARVIGAPLRISHQYPHWPLLSQCLVNRTLAPDYQIHCVDNNLNLLRFVDAAPKLPEHGYELHPSQEDQQWASAQWAGRGLGTAMVLGIHVGSGGTKNLALRRWPVARFIELIRRLGQSHPHWRVALFGGPGESRDHELVVSELGRDRVWIPETGDLRKSAALIGRCRVFLSVDTSLMHVAAAMQVPSQVVIETPSWNKTVEPYGRRFVLVPNPAVAGNNLDWYRYDGRGIRGTAEEITRCMGSVTVEAVHSAIAGLLND